MWNLETWDNKIVEVKEGRLDFKSKGANKWGDLKDGPMGHRKDQTKKRSITTKRVCGGEPVSGTNFQAAKKKRKYKKNCQFCPRGRDTVTRKSFLGRSSKPSEGEWTSKEPKVTATEFSASGRGTLLERRQKN